MSRDAAGPRQWEVIFLVDMTAIENISEHDAATKERDLGKE
jgi:hypothetical protein